MNETQFLNKLKPQLPGCFWKIHGGIMQAAGLPDLIGIWRGRFVGIELKVYPNTVTKIQEATLERIALSGGIALVFTKRDEQLCVTSYYREINIQVNHKLLNPLPISMLSKESLREIFLSCQPLEPIYDLSQKRSGVN